MSQVEGRMIRSIEEQGESVPGGIGGKVFLRNGRVSCKPVLCRKFCDTGEKRRIHIGPGLLQLGRGERVRQRAIRIGDVTLIELRVETLSEKQQWQHSVMDGCEVSQQVEKPVPAGSNLLEKLFLVMPSEEFIQAAGDSAP